MSGFGSHINEINLIDQPVAELDEERNQLLQRKQQLLSSLQTQKSKSHLTTAQKVSIFKNRFRGRDDIYTTRWQNAQPIFVTLKIIIHKNSMLRTPR